VALPAGLEVAEVVEAAPPEPQAAPPAWERREELGFARALRRTVAGFLFHPRRAAAGVRGRTLAEPLLFAVLVLSLTTLASFALLAALLLLGLHELLARSEPETVSRFLALTWGSVFLAGALAPFAAAAALLVVSAVVHLAALVVGASKRGFRVTFAAVAYASGGALPLAVLPFLGPPAALLWWLVSLAGALAGAHRTSAARATAAVLLPLVAGMVALGLLAFVSLAAVGAALGARP
jgi:hypothetical protein